MSLPRRVEPEWLDELPADDPSAVRSRRDLRRVNRVMGALAIVLRALGHAAGPPPRVIVELGAGDGTFMLRLARKRAREWREVRLILLDRQPIVSPATVSDFNALGWEVEVVVTDVLDWLAEPIGEPADLMFANLFLHHFAAEGLSKLLAGAARRSRLFLACEPHRSALALAGSRMIGVLGCNAVTRHDALASVRAGFRGQELSTLWSEPRGWTLREWRAGLFSHAFLATQLSG